MTKEGMGAKPVKTLEKPDGGLIAANTGIQRKQPRPDGSGSITQKEQVLLDYPWLGLSESLRWRVRVRMYCKQPEIRLRM